MNSESLEEEWNNKICEEMDYDCPSRPVNISVSDDAVTLFISIKTGSSGSPYVSEPSEIDEWVSDIQEQGYQISSTESSVEFEEGEKRPKFYYFDKEIKVPDEVSTKEEFYQLICDNA